MFKEAEVCITKGVDTMNNEKKEHAKESVLEFLYQKRNSHAKVFPFCKDQSDDFIKRIQGVSLTKRAVKALRRA